MKFSFTSALSALALVAPILGAELEDRNHRYYGQQQAQAQDANVVTVHDTVVSTKFATQFVTVTVGDQGAQCTQVADAIVTTTAHSGSGSGSGSNNNNNNNQNHQAATRTAAAHHHLATVTSTRVFTTTITRETPVTITETTRNSVHVHTVTRTVTEHVRQTQVVTDTITVQETDFVTDHVTQTDDAAAAEQTTTTTGDAGIADVNTDVVTVTDVETSTFFFTTTVDGVVATETGTTTITSDASASTSDVGGNIADVTTTNTDTSTTTSTAASANGTDDPQTSLTLDPRVIESGFAQDGQETPAPGQVKSLTSTNNFINFCLTQNVPLTDGKQIRTGSCNVVPQGFIIAKDKIPSAKFVFPLNFSKIPANQPFTAKLKIKNLQAGAFTNANTNYYAAPAQVNAQGILIGHSHLVIEAINGLDDTEPADPTKFAFFKGLNAPLDGDDTVSAALANGLPAGTYRMFSINTAANHQPALASIAQHGSMDDGVYFTCE